MKKLFCLFFFSTILFSCSTNGKKKSTSESQLPKVAICGLAIESSTFSPAVSTEASFRVRRGEQVYTYYPFMEEGEENRNRANWVPTLRGHAIPGGLVLREVYEKLVNETLD